MCAYTNAEYIHAVARPFLTLLLKHVFSLIWAILEYAVLQSNFTRWQNSECLFFSKKVFTIKKCSRRRVTGDCVDETAVNGVTADGVFQRLPLSITEFGESLFHNAYLESRGRSNVFLSPYRSVDESSSRRSLNCKLLSQIDFIM